MRTSWFFLIALACALACAAGCDKLSPFVSDEAYAHRLDRDNDGVPNAQDCAPDDPKITTFPFWHDLDGDGFGAGEPVQGCKLEQGLSDKAGDCNDGNPKVHPGAAEVCNLIDDNCNDQVDEGFVSRWYRDKDNDGYGNPNDHMDDCGKPNGYVDNALDCNDESSAVKPGAAEVCDDGIDQNCDGVTDNAEQATLQCVDADHDNAGNPLSCVYACQALPNHVVNQSDCDDTNPSVGPAAPEVCGDGVDNNCNGVTDTDAVDTAWYRDQDNDGFGDPKVAQTACAPPQGFVGNALDCDDTKASVKPGVAEICNNGIDDNCDGTPNLCVTSGKKTIDQAEITIEGTGSNLSLTGADLNDDGSDDLVITTTGTVHVFFGPIPNGIAALNTAQTVVLNGTASLIFDANDDGKSDLAVGDGSNVHIFLGPLAVGVLNPNTAQIHIDMGAPVSLLYTDDFNGDSKNDLLIVSGNVAYLFLGPFANVSKGIADAQTTFTEDGGISSVAILDVNANGIKDIVIGLPSLNLVTVFLGPFATTSLSGANAQITLTGKNPNEAFGETIAGLSDFNGDGKADLAVGAYLAEGNAVGGGTVYIFLGPLVGGNISANAASAAIQGNFADWNGTSLETGDLNQDGLSDLLIGAKQGHDKGKSVGCVYLLNGTNAPMSISISALETHWCGVKELDTSSVLSKHLLDLNDDGVVDVVMGSTGAHTVSVFLGIGL
ncbi:FG-GAP repeat protein [Candidatus Uhrbacteria bacterium]|nr:FG-GAP repeat protein [Candidatus Uhrbacteria bacterium]